MDNRPIGVFDSGIGGLTVVDALAKSMPNESILYVGDTARVPYGNKSKIRIKEFATEITEWLVNKNAKMIVVACNTASSLALNYIKSKFDLPIIGVIEPGIHCAVAVTKNNRICVLGTNATIKSDAYGDGLRLANNQISVVSQACPLFVPLVEEGWVSGSVPTAIATTYLEPIKRSNVDTLILGCTHYPLLKSIIVKILGSDISLIDSGQATATVVNSVLKKNNIVSNENTGDIHCYVTDSSNFFEALVGRFVNANISKITHVDIS
jgi:glutamate racemase